MPGAGITSRLNRCPICGEVHSVVASAALGDDLSSAGDRFAGAISPSGGEGGDKPRWMFKASVSKTLAGQSVKDGVLGKKGGPKGPKWKVKLFEDIDELFHVWKGEISGSKDFGPATASGSLSASALGAELKKEFSLGKDGLKAEAGAKAYLAEMKAQGSIDIGPAAVGVTAAGMIGAEAKGGVAIGKEGLKADAEVFVGGKVEGSAHADIAGVGAGIKGEAWAGVGIAAESTFGMKDGKFTIGGEVGAALLVGGKVGFEVTVDVGKVIDTAEDVADAVGDAASAVGGAIGDAASAAGDAASWVGDKIKFW